MIAFMGKKMHLTPRQEVSKAVAELVRDSKKLPDQEGHWGEVALIMTCEPEVRAVLNEMALQEYPQHIIDLFKKAAAEHLLTLTHFHSRERAWDPETRTVRESPEAMSFRCHQAPLEGGTCERCGAENVRGDQRCDVKEKT